MTTIISEIYDAFKSCGADDDKARAAAQAIAEYNKDISDIKGSLMLLKWMLGVVLAFVMAIMWKVF